MIGGAQRDLFSRSVTSVCAQLQRFADVASLSVCFVRFQCDVII